MFRAEHRFFGRYFIGGSEIRTIMSVFLESSHGLSHQPFLAVAFFDELVDETIAGGSSLLVPCLMT